MSPGTSFDIDDTTNPLEAGLGWATKLDKAGGFIGRDALVAIKNAGLQRKLVGLKMIDRGIARHGHPVHASDGSAIGVVTSGTQPPSVNAAIAMAYVAKGHDAIGTRVLVDVRGRMLAAEVCKTPFYNKNS